MALFDLSDTRYQLALIALLVLIAAGGAVDLVLDAPTSLWTFHVLFEAAFVLLCLATAGSLAAAALRAQRALRQTHATLQQRQDELDEWRERAQRFLQGLALEIDRQLRAWGLTPAERETALFLLKGYSTKEIAELLGKSERTVRQHCSAGYKKSGLAGRAELSAFFLEDLLVPLDESVDARARSAGPPPSEPSTGLA